MYLEGALLRGVHPSGSSWTVETDGMHVRLPAEHAAASLETGCTADVSSGCFITLAKMNLELLARCASAGAACVRSKACMCDACMCVTWCTGDVQELAALRDLVVPLV